MPFQFNLINVSEILKILNDRTVINEEIIEDRQLLLVLDEPIESFKIPEANELDIDEFNKFISCVDNLQNEINKKLKPSKSLSNEKKYRRITTKQ